MNEIEKHNLVIEKWNLLKNIVPDLNALLAPFLKHDCINLLFYMHLGDDFLRMSYVHDIERKYGSPVNVLIEKNKIFIAKLFGINNYTIIDLKPIKTYLKKNFDNDVIFEYFFFHYIEHIVGNTPAIGKLSVLFCLNDICPNVEKKLGVHRFVVEFLADCWGVERRKIAVNKITYPKLSSLTIKKLQNIAPLDKIVLFLPEARSDEIINIKVWNAIAKKIKSAGFIIIENVMRPDLHIDGAINLNLSVDELIEVGCNCNSIFSIRSGLCDIFITKGKDLYVFWTPERYGEIGRLFGFKENFEADSYPREFILSAKKKPKIMWNGIDLGEGLKKEWMPDYIPFSKKVTTFFKKYPIIGIKVNRAGEIKKKKFYFFFMPIITTRKSPEKLTKKFLGLTFYKSKR